MQLNGVYWLVSNAQSFFDEVPEKNVVSCTPLMVGYLDNEDLLEAVNIYQDIRRKGICCDHNTFTTVTTSYLEDETMGSLLCH